MSRKIQIAFVVSIITVVASPSPASAGLFDIFKRCKKKTVCCPAPSAVSVMAVESATEPPEIRQMRTVTGMVCFTHPDYPGQTFYAIGPPKSGDASVDCSTLQEQSCADAAANLPPGSEVEECGCYEADGNCENEFTCTPCGDGYRRARYTAQFHGRCCRGCCISGAPIAAQDRCAAIDMARRSFEQAAKNAGCRCICWKRCTIRVKGSFTACP